MSTDDAAAAAAPTDAAVPASSPASLNFCAGADSPDVKTFFTEHTPDPRQATLVHHVNRHHPPTTVLPGKRAYNAQVEAKQREAHDQAAAAASSPDDADDSPREEDLHVEYSRTLVCNAPRALLWRVMMQKARSPADKPGCGVRNVHVLCEGADYVFREFDVGPEDAPEHIKEKVTWDEASESVRYDLYEDPMKEGYIESAISVDASLHVCLEVSCNWTFLPHPDLTRSALTKWRQMLRRGLDASCAQIVRLCEEEAKEQALERRRRNSLSQSKDNEMQRAMQAATQQYEMSEKKAHDKVEVQLSVSPAPGAVRTVNVAGKPEGK